MVVRLFTDPEKYLERKSAIGRIYEPGAIVVLVALSYTLQPIAFFYALEPAEVDIVMDLLTVQWIGYLLWGLGLWGIFTFMLYVLSSLVGGKPLLGHMVRVVGWGMAPMILTGVVWSAGKYVVFQDYTLTEPDYPGVDQQNIAFSEFTAQAAGDPVLIGTTLLGCLFVAVSGYLWAAGLVTASNIDIQKARLVSGITVVIYVLFKLVPVV